MSDNIAQVHTASDRLAKTVDELRSGYRPAVIEIALIDVTVKHIRLHNPTATTAIALRALSKVVLDMAEAEEAEVHAFKEKN